MNEEKQTVSALYKKYYSMWCIHLDVCFCANGDLSYSLAVLYG